MTVGDSSISKIKYLAILESISQVKHFLKFKQYRQHSLIFAWTPAVSQYLDKRNISHKCLSEFMNFKEINNIGLGLIEKVSFISKKIDTISAQHFRNKAYRDFPLGSAAWFKMKVLLAFYLVAAVALKRVLTTVQAEQIIICQRKTCEYLLTQEKFFSSESLLQEIFSHQNINFINLSLKGDLTRYADCIAMLKSIFKKLLSKALCVKNGLLMHARKSNKLILFFQKNYSLIFLFSHFKKGNKYTPMLLHGFQGKKEDAVRDIDQMLFRIKNDPDIKAQLDCYGINFSNFFFKYVDIHLKNELSQAIGSFSWFEKHKDRIVLMLHGSISSIRDKFLFYLAGLNNIKRVVVGHGDYHGCYMRYAFKNLSFYFNEGLWADKVFVPGIGEKEYLDENFGVDSKTESTGYVILERLRRRQVFKRKRKRLVIYPITSIGYLSYNAPIRDRTLFEQSEIIKAISMCFQQLPYYDLIIKPAPKFKKIFNRYLAIDGFIKDHHLSNVVIDDTPFQKLIVGANLFIVDYTSTMLLEMLTTDRPIIFANVYHPRLNNSEKWDVNKLSFWRNRIITLNSIEEIKTRLTGLVEDNISKSYPDIEFLERYGVHKDDGKCLERMVDVLMKEISSGERER